MPSSFQGTFTPEGEVAPRSAIIVVTPDGLEARSPHGGAVRLDFQHMTLEVGGFEGDFIFCRAPGGAGVVATNERGFVEALAEVAPGLLAEQLAGVGSQKRRRLAWGWITGLGFVFAIVLLGLLLWNVPTMLAATVDGLPTEIDETLGEAAAADLQMGADVDDPAIDALMAEIIARLAPHATTEGLDFRVDVVRNEEMNAFALPGGQMVVFTGLLEAADRPEQVAGVMAHEMAHVTRRHGLRNVAHQAGIMLAVSLLLGDVEGWAELAAEVAVMAKANDYSRDQEADADAEGTRMLVAAGLDPEGLVGFFELLQGEAGTELAGAMGWLSTHPDHASRIAHVREVASELPTTTRRPLSSDWGAVKRAIGDPP